MYVSSEQAWPSPQIPPVRAGRESLQLWKSRVGEIAHEISDQRKWRWKWKMFGSVQQISIFGRCFLRLCRWLLAGWLAGRLAGWRPGKHNKSWVGRPFEYGEIKEGQIWRQGKQAGHKCSAEHLTCELCGLWATNCPQPLEAVWSHLKPSEAIWSHLKPAVATWSDSLICNLQPIAHGSLNPLNCSLSALFFCLLC